MCEKEIRAVPVEDGVRVKLLPDMEANSTVSTEKRVGTSPWKELSLTEREVTLESWKMVKPDLMWAKVFCSMAIMPSRSLMVRNTPKYS